MIYLDIGGQGPGLVPPERAFVPVSDRGLLLGDGLFETMLMRDGQIPLLSQHLARMSASARALDIPFAPETAAQGARAVAAALNGAGGPSGQGAAEYAIRITLTRGATGPRGYLPPANPNPTLLITSAPYHRPAGPLSAVTASFRINEISPLRGHKSLSAMEKVMARGEAARAGCDEAILINRAGRVAEAAAANLFIVRQGLWMTPPLTDGCLPGVMRQRVLALTGGVEWQIAPEDLFRCDGVYLTSALMGCLPLGALDGRVLPWGSSPAFLDKLFRP